MSSPAPSRPSLEREYCFETAFASIGPVGLALSSAIAQPDSEVRAIVSGDPLLHGTLTADMLRERTFT